jgi:hypothetical protein
MEYPVFQSLRQLKFFPLLIRAIFKNNNKKTDRKFDRFRYFAPCGVVCCVHKQATIFPPQIIAFKSYEIVLYLLDKDILQLFNLSNKMQIIR